ncbi:MAG TPA: regulatory protein RecX [Firmicutes bacterium]|nr:regulatory protein RecX [Bacillota bacterium]
MIRVNAAAVSSCSTVRRRLELDHALAIAAGIRVGATISRSDLAELVRKDSIASAEKDALALLTRRDHSEAELRKKLRAKDHDAAAIDVVVARCTDWGYLDDERIARQLVNDAINLKRLGPARIKQKLGELGIDKDVAREAISRAEDNAPSPVEQALGALASKRRSYARLDAETARRRMYGFLQRRGFDFDTVRAAVERFENELRDAE